jgi:hypothetical protein
MVEKIVWPDHKDTYSNWWAAENVSGEPVPGSAGSAEEFTLSVSEPETYYFAIRTYDAASNRSDISNMATVIVGAGQIDPPPNAPTGLHIIGSN